MELLRSCATVLFFFSCSLVITKINSASEEDILQQIARSQLTGISTDNYEWGTSSKDFHLINPVWDTVWIRPTAEATPDAASYAALSHQMNAIPYWGQRVQFQAQLGRRDLDPSGAAFAVMFVRVVSADSRTLAFDNMKDRHAVGVAYSRSTTSIVLDVPGPPSDGCPAEGSLPSFIHAGFLLFGGAGYVDLSEASFGVVSRTTAVTGGPPPWLPPGLEFPWID